METSSQSTTPQNADEILVYLLAASEEEDECKYLENHLSAVINSSEIPIRIYSDYNCIAGGDKEAHKQRMKEADIVLALISVDFISNNEIDKRFKDVINRYNEGKTKLLPIWTRFCYISVNPFDQLNLLPKDRKPLQKGTSDHDDARFALLAGEISDVIKQITQEQSGHSQQKLADNSKIEVLSEISPVHQSKPSTSIQTSSVKPPEIPIDTNWRKGYYKKVLRKRAYAFIIDQILMIILAFVLGALLFNFIDDSDILNLTPLAIVLFYFFWAAYFESSKWLGTPGKRIMNLKITDRVGHPVSFFKSLGRNIVKLIIAYAYVFSFGILLIIQVFTFKYTKKLFHDQLSFTVIGDRVIK